MPVLPILIVIVIVVAIAAIASVFVFNLNSKKKLKKIKKDASKEAGINQANKRLAKDPRDQVALAFLAKAYSEDEDWEKALPCYAALSEMELEIDNLTQFEANINAAAISIKLGDLGKGYEYLLFAHALDEDHFEVNYQLGLFEYNRNNFEKALQYLLTSLNSKAGYEPTLRILGYSYYKLNRLKEGTAYIRSALELDPSNKETQFMLAQCYTFTDRKPQALKVYSSLRPDSQWGPQSCLASGIINLELHDREQALSDFEIGLKHKSIDEDTALELRYKLANLYLEDQDISSAMYYLEEIKSIRANYKDSDKLIVEYKEMNANRNLQIYIMAPTADFLVLCRKVVITYFEKAKVKITKTASAGNDWTDFLAEIDTAKWSDVVMFRFIRTQGTIGEFVVRDFHSHIKDAKASKGICIGVGIFSDEAIRFTETRLIDLIDKAKLAPILVSVDAKMNNQSKKRKA